MMIIFDFFLNLYSLFFISLFFTDFSFLFSFLHNKFNFPLNDISNISTQASVFAMFLFIRWLIDKDSFLDIRCIKAIKNIGNLKDRTILVSMFVIFMLIFLSLGIARHLALSSSGIDLAAFDQAIWNTANGDILFSSIAGNINILGAHFEPILLLIAPLYMVWPNIIVLIILQALALGVAIFPLYWIAKNRLNNRILIFAFILAYFLSRAVRGVGFLDFHTDSFLVPLIFCSYYFLVTKRTIAALLSLFLMLLCKEDVTFLVSAFGIFLCIFQKRYKLGIFLFFAGIVGWIVETSIIMPRFANTQNYPYLSWLPFGETYTQNINAVLQKPSLLIGLFFSLEKTAFYLRLFGPLGFLSFLSPAHYVLFLVPLTEQAIGSLRHGGMQTITSHYPAHTIPFIFISAIYGAGWLIDKFVKNRPKFAWYLAIYIALLSLLFYGKTDGHKFAKFLMGAKEIHAQEIRSYLRLIPPGASVCAVNNLVPHLSHRKYIYLWYDLNSFKYNAEYIVLYKDLLEQGKDNLTEIVDVLAQKGYKNIFSDKENTFFILFNPKFDRAVLKNQPAQIMSLTE